MHHSQSNYTHEFKIGASEGTRKSRYIITNSDGVVCITPELPVTQVKNRHSGLSSPSLIWLVSICFSLTLSPCSRSRRRFSNRIHSPSPNTNTMQTALQQHVATKVGIYLYGHHISSIELQRPVKNPLRRIFSSKGGCAQNAGQVTEANEEARVRRTRVLMHVVIVMPGVYKTRWYISTCSHQETREVGYCLVIQHVDGCQYDHPHH